jgi:nucleotide-binding universal stress UspA family protein
MILRPSILCPIDFSGSSRGALRYAGAIAAHFGARLTLLVVNDPLLEEADEFSGPAHLGEDTTRQLERFFRQTFAERPHGIPEIHLEVTTGKSAPEILRVSHEKGCDLIVMSSHGVTGFRKMFFGSTTERVLRETTVPVLVTPGSDAGPEKLEDILGLVRRVLAPVDLTAATPYQLQVARGLAEAIQVPIVLLHVVEPVRTLSTGQPRLSKVDAERRYRAERELESAVQDLPPRIKPEALVAYGEPAEEIAKVATDRDAGIIIMGLHSSPVLGPRMGSVTYRVLCLAHRVVLAIPPLPAASQALDSTEDDSYARERLKPEEQLILADEPAGS